jgi:hypothetical protein
MPMPLASAVVISIEPASVMAARMLEIWIVRFKM